MRQVDVVLDTDTYNEIDDQFALSYLLRSKDKARLRGICAAPFKNARAATPAEGMEKSYNEIHTLLRLAGETEFSDRVYRGSCDYLPNEGTPVESDAADFLAEIVNEYSPEEPLYVIAIGAITNVASAILKNPAFCENAVVVWLGGHAHTDAYPVYEFNMIQDIAAARVVFNSKVPLVQFPCRGVVDRFATTKYELEHWLRGKNELCDYLVDAVIREAESYASGTAWSRVIWDVCAVSWVTAKEQTFFLDTKVKRPVPEHDGFLSTSPIRPFMTYIYNINRDNLFDDLFKRLAQ